MAHTATTRAEAFDPFHEESTELPLSDVVDRIETISTHHATQRAILETAEARSIIEREGATVTLSSGQTGPQFQSGITIVSRLGAFHRCHEGFIQRRLLGTLVFGHRRKVDLMELFV